MGILANALPLDDVMGADNTDYKGKNGKILVKTSVQGVNLTGVNTFRMQTLLPTLAVPSYLIHLPSAI